MASLVLYLSASVLFAQSTFAFNCSRAPVYVDIHKRAVHESPVFQYGSFIGVGTPAQNHSLWPSISQNHTSFASIDYCNNSTLKNCADSTGGRFVASESETFKENKDFKSLDVGRNTSTFEGILGTDTVRLYTHYFETDGASQTLLEDSLIEVAQEGSITPSIVGVGLSSTVLQDLVKKEVIAGRTYSLYIGQGFDRAGGAVNGSNTFGGYDAGRFTGPVHTYKMKETNVNPLTVRVKDIVITDSNSANSNVSLFDNSVFPNTDASTFEAQLTTDQYPLSLPYALTQNFIKHLNAQTDNYWGDNSLKLKDKFNGTLSIVLDDGFTVTIPAEVLSNFSNITPIQDRAKDSDAPFYLSAAFLGQVYLMADYDSYTFYLAEAVQKNNAVMPETFCPKTVPVAYERPKPNPWIQQGLIGAVIGGVIGGAGIAVFVYCLIVAFLRKRLHKKQEREVEKGQQAKMAQFEVDDSPAFDPPPRRAKLAFWGKK